MIYADNAATTKMSRAAIDAMVACLENDYGNPSSLYALGQNAKERLEQARAEIAAVIGAEPREITFTSGGSEADNQAIRSAAALGKKKGRTHIISTAFEHHAVLHTLKKLEQEGFEVTLLDVHEDGLVRPEEVETAIREDRFRRNSNALDRNSSSAPRVSRKAIPPPRRFFFKIESSISDPPSLEDMRWSFFLCQYCSLRIPVQIGLHNSDLRLTRSWR